MKRFLRFFGILPPKFTNNPADFRLRMKWCWFNDSQTDYVFIQYSGNKGKSWKYLLEAEEPLLDRENWGLKRLSRSINDAQHYPSFIKSMDDVDRHNEEQIRYVKEGRERDAQERIERNKRISESFDKFN